MSVVCADETLTLGIDAGVTKPALARPKIVYGPPGTSSVPARAAPVGGTSRLKVPSAAEVVWMPKPVEREGLLVAPANARPQFAPATPAMSAYGHEARVRF